MQQVLGIPLLFSCLSSLVYSHAIGERQSSIPYGSLITGCTQPGVVALTFDDGPAEDTATVLDKLKAAGQRATFFINGDNYEYIYDYNSTVQRYITDGHQIGSHTWSHAHLPTLSNDGIILEMTRLEDALVNILGYFPYYMRFPYLEYGTTALAIMAQLEYHVIDLDINTQDWLYNTVETEPTSEQQYTDGLNEGGTISLSHDPEPLTGMLLVDYMINEITSRGLQSVPVGECLGAPPSEWYRPARSVPPVSSTSTSSTATGSTSSTSTSATPTGVTSPDDTCGGTNGYICAANKCCSRYGFCGTTNDYCIGQNCQPAFGICNSPLPSGTTSPDGTCGGTNGYICPTDKCCSVSGW
ncbi:hypothetical protein BX600DRAFT_471181 [Xylariales sp. PMI_506]|nr:hypothetical protein BX600DRAFT_471181 [Xylariales sp. PMI_506]